MWWRSADKKKIPLLWENTGSCVVRIKMSMKRKQKEVRQSCGIFDCGAENFTWDGSSLSSMIPVRGDES